MPLIRPIVYPRGNAQPGRGPEFRTSTEIAALNDHGAALRGMAPEEREAYLARLKEDGME